VFRLIALMVVGASFTLGACLNVFLGHREMVRKYAGSSTFVFWTVFLVSSITLVGSIGFLTMTYGVRATGLFTLLTALYTTVLWLWGHHISADHSQEPRSSRGKLSAVLWLIVSIVGLFLLWTGVAAGAGDYLPKWSDLLFILSMIGLVGCLHEFFVRRERTRIASGFWRILIVSSIAMAVAIVWGVVGSLMG